MPGVTLQDIQRLDLSRVTLDGTVITATGAELNKLAGVTAGTVTASKAIVVDSDKQAAQFTHDETLQTAATGSTGTVLASRGTIVVSTSAAKTFQMAAPRTGATVHIIATHASTLVKTISLASGNFDSSGTKTKLLFNGANDAVTITGISTARFIITSNVGSVTTST